MVEFYTACGADTPEGGIYRCRIGADGTPEIVDFQAVRGAGYFACAPDRQTLYVTGTAPGLEAAGAAAFRVTASGALQFLNGVATVPGGGCHLDVSPDGRFLYTADYYNGSVSEIALAADGSLTGSMRQIQHCGSGPCGNRQSRAHVHYTRITPDGRFLCVADLGMDEVICYPLTADGIDAAGGIVLPVDPGSGPRHLAFSRNGKRAWLVTEMGNTIWTLDYQDGRFSLIDRRSTLQSGYPDPFSKAAAIRLDADEKFLFVSNRGQDDLACFPLDDNGMLQPGKWCGAAGTFPRDILLLADGRTMITANETSGNLGVLQFDAATGELRETGRSLALPYRPIGLIAR